MVEVQYEYAGKSYPVRITKNGDEYKVLIGEKDYLVKSKEVKPGYFTMKINGKPVKLSMASEGNQRHIFFNGHVFRFTRSEGRKRGKGDYDAMSPEITSPISGKVVKVEAEEGAHVEGGQTLITIEAMKMEYQIKAPYKGRVDKIKFKQGDQVDIGMVLVEMKKTEDE
jgi:3-methylcrotonyl-CoA carboxylase alpha subunit